MQMRRLVVIFWSLLFLTAPLRAADGGPHPLEWDAMAKTSEPQVGESVAVFVFAATNRSAQAVTIKEIRSSCGCTIVESAPTPLVLAPGASSRITALVDFRGKDGHLTKSLFVATSAGPQTLLMNVKVPVMDEATRRQNQATAQADRKAVFRGECASCHAAPADGKLGGELFAAVCAVCHVSAHRASMVPDLLVARERRDTAYWQKWIAEGKADSLMPAFAAEKGGPLAPRQIDSLVEYLLANLPTEPRPN